MTCDVVRFICSANKGSIFPPQHDLSDMAAMDTQPQLVNQQTLALLKQQIGSEMLPVVLATFIGEGQRTLAQLVDLPSNELKRCCHTLKSSAAAIGADALAAHAAQLDNKLKQNPNESISSAELTQIYSDTLIALRQMLR